MIYTNPQINKELNELSLCICSILYQFIDCAGDLELFNENLSLSAEIHLQ